jgi:hypothetical protein
MHAFSHVMKLATVALTLTFVASGLTSTPPAARADPVRQFPLTGVYPLHQQVTLRVPAVLIVAPGYTRSVEFAVKTYNEPWVYARLDNRLCAVRPLDRLRAFTPYEELGADGGWPAGRRSPVSRRARRASSRS